MGATAVKGLVPLLEECPKAVLIEHFRPVFLGFRQLRPGVLAGDEVVRLLRHAAIRRRRRGA